MQEFVFLSFLISLSALFAYLNVKFFKLPFVIGLFIQTTILSLLILIFNNMYLESMINFNNIMNNINVSKIILDFLLGFLLFAGAIHTKWSNIKLYIKEISVLSIFGVMISTVLIGLSFFYLCRVFNIQIDIATCFLFGALISPTDPIAVLGILKEAKVPQKIESIVIGESLFNDGIGVVIFIAILESILHNQGNLDLTHVGFLFVKEAVGGILFGLVLGFLIYKLLKSIDHYETEILLTISFVMSGYLLSNYIHISGALAMVVMGLFIGNYKQDQSMSDTTQEYVYKFWEIFDVILNSIFFILIAFTIVILNTTLNYLIISLATVFIVLLARSIAVLLPMKLFPKFLNINFNESKMLIWGGLRGGLSIALVLSLPKSEYKNLILLSTYFCVLFSIIVQGLTIEKFAKKVLKA